MTHLYHGIDIARPPEAVLDYTSTAARWPEWHPSSLRVEGPTTPLVAGDRFDEDIHAGGREGHLVWTVVEAERGRRWRARATGSNGVELELRYEVFPIHAGTRFVRSLEYQLDGMLMRVANVLVLRRRIERESAESLRILKQVLEGQPAR